ncbi:glycosyltransferase family 25 protein [Teredinibacter purpureus]|uniref:glycosyltransferase family 25 protein n=1 Tax=Teredinibacter purpureus TaxID=2731756 RepID=UPI000696A72F|nr:glycosyltransferase family 25 protein [Teredinibacter purpureus]
MKYDTFLINLDKSEDRLRLCTKALNDINVKFERISAVYGGDLTEQEIAHFGTTEKHSYHKTLNAGEIGCYLSHRKAWELIVDRQLDFALILEDDFHPENADMTEVIDLLGAIKTPWHYIKLAGRKKRLDAIFSASVGDMKYNLLRKVPTLTCAQAVSLDGARRLLESTQRFSRPIDVDLQYWWEKNIWIHNLLPYPFTPITNSVSEIDFFSKRKQSNKNRVKKIMNQLSYTLNLNTQTKKLKRLQPELLTHPTEDILNISVKRGS